MNLSSTIEQLLDNNSLSQQQMSEIMNGVMTGACSVTQVAGFLVALRAKGENIDEISGAVETMRSLAAGVKVNHPNAIDIVGTGGDSANLFNVSTAASFVVSAAGGVVAKHGNRSVSSTTGAADVLEAAGVNLALSAADVSRCVDELGIGFMFAVNHHGAMKHAITPRRELGVRTIFNLLGPLTNPAGVQRQLIGVYDRKWLRPLAEVLQRLGSQHVILVHSADGLDEISPVEQTYYAELKGNRIIEGVYTPETLGISPLLSLDSLSVSSAAQSLALISAALSGVESDASRMIALNAGVALYVAGIAKNEQEGVALAMETLLSGKAAHKLSELVQLSQSMQE